MKENTKLTKVKDIFEISKIRIDTEKVFKEIDYSFGT